MFGRIKTGWKALGIATQLRKAWKRGGGGAAAGGAVALAVDPKPVGQFIIGVLHYFAPDFVNQLPAQASIEVLGVLGAMLIGWIIGATKDAATEKVEERSARKQAAKQAGAGGA